MGGKKAKSVLRSIITCYFVLSACHWSQLLGSVLSDTSTVCEWTKSESVENETRARITHETVLQDVEGLLHYLEQQDDEVQLAEKFLHKKVQSWIKKRGFQNMKQKRVTFFFFCLNGYNWILNIRTVMF